MTTEQEAILAESVHAILQDLTEIKTLLATLVAAIDQRLKST